MALISVVIPTHNRPEKTNRAIKSVLDQGVDCKIIVVDDGSDTPFHLDSPNDVASVTLIRLQTNQGASAARNAGIDACETELIAFLDSDDQMLPNTFERRINHALQHGVADEKTAPVIIVCGWREEDVGGKNPKNRIPRPTARPDDLFLGCWFGPGSTAIARTSLFKSDVGKFDTGLKRLEDYDWYLRFALKSGKIKTQHEVMVLIERNRERNPDEITSAIAKLRDWYGKGGKRGNLSRRQNRWLEAYLLYEEAKLHWMKGKWLNCFRALLYSYMKRLRLRPHPGPGWQTK